MLQFFCVFTGYIRSAGAVIQLKLTVEVLIPFLEFCTIHKLLLCHGYILIFYLSLYSSEPNNTMSF